MKRISIVFFLILSSLFVGLNAAYGESADEVYKPVLRQTSDVSLSSLNEQRSDKYVDLLSVSVKVSSGGSSGSGTICHYDPSSGLAYVVSCGHLWDGSKSYSPKNTKKAQITTWYKGKKKLASPESFEAEALFWSNDRGYDTSLVRFRPDWIPPTARIAKDFTPTPGMVLNSMGCDGGREVARYEVRVKEFGGQDLITNVNSPRPGRSGGGLLTDDMRMVGVCWGTSEVSSGNGIGYFTPLHSFKSVLSKNGHGWITKPILELYNIPVLDRQRPDRTYGRDFIPMPLF
jgi:hypothetical protein